MNSRRKNSFSSYSRRFMSTTYWSSLIVFFYLLIANKVYTPTPYWWWWFDSWNITERVIKWIFELLNRYEDRQLFLLSNLPVGSSVIIGSSSQKYQSWSIPFPYKQNSSFHYLCGIDQPHFLLVLQKLQRNTVRRCLFMKSKPE